VSLDDDVYGAPCLEVVYEALAEALLQAFLDRRWPLVEGRPRGERWRRWWRRSALAGRGPEPPALASD
jgi:hypothetical protein